MKTGCRWSPTNNRFRDGSYSNFNNTDLDGYAGFNEIFPLFSWYVIETDSTRYKNTGTHVVYDAGGPADGTHRPARRHLHHRGQPGQYARGHPGSRPICVYPARSIAQLQTAPTRQLRHAERVRTALQAASILRGFRAKAGRDSPARTTSSNSARSPYAVGENGGIHGEVIYASTRPFDDPALLIHTSWTPDVPNVTINLYKEGTAPDGSTSLTLVDTTKTSSFDDWAQGFPVRRPFPT